MIDDDLEQIADMTRLATGRNSRRGARPYRTVRRIATDRRESGLAKMARSDTRRQEHKPKVTLAGDID